MNLPNELLNDDEIIEKTLIKCDRMLKPLADKIKNNKKMALLAIKRNISYFDFFSNKLKNDEEIFLHFILGIKDHKKIKDIIGNNKELASIVLKKNATLIRYLSDELKNDKEIDFIVTQNDIKNIQFLSKNLRNDYDFFCAMVNKNDKYKNSEFKSVKNFLWQY